MKYAKFDDDFLSYFRLDDNGETLVLTDKRGCTRAIKLLPYEERPQGKWKVRTADDGLIYYQCTVCWKNNFFEDFPFCPYCGASMKTGRLRKGNDNGKNL